MSTNSNPKTNAANDDAQSYKELEELRDHFDSIFTSEDDCFEELIRHIKPGRSGHKEG